MVAECLVVERLVAEHPGVAWGWGNIASPAVHSINLKANSIHTNNLQFTNLEWKKLKKKRDSKGAKDMKIMGGGLGFQGW